VLPTRWRSVAPVDLLGGQLGLQAVDHGDCMTPLSRLIAASLTSPVRRRFLRVAKRAHMAQYFGLNTFCADRSTTRCVAGNAATWSGPY